MRKKLSDLLEEVCRAHFVHPEELFARDNRPAISSIRREFALRAREAGYSYPQIGCALHRHHTTIMALLGNL